MTKMQLLLIGLVLFIFGIAACSDDTNTPDTSTTSFNSCEGCHTNYSKLKEVHSPDTSAANGGCGGEAPHFEPYDRVFMGGDDFKTYKATAHGKLACTQCHNGVDKTGDKNVAHSGNFVAHPSTIHEEKCGQCHSSITSKFKNSIHFNGWGQKRKVTLRSGLAGSQDFDKLPAHQIKGYNSKCATCHASCGECHVVRPQAGGGGLAKSHIFSKQPDYYSVCITCHSSRGGHAFLGMASGTQADVHRTKLGYTCISCHSKDELHGDDGLKHNTRFEVPSLPQCTDCHKDISSSNSYHSVHMSNLSCNTCHSQNYNTCGSCHIGGEGARITSHLEFKMAMNPIKNIKKDFNIALVRRTLAAPDNWVLYGVPQYANFEAVPTFNYTTPHNILKWTTRTAVGQGKKCYENCHIVKEGEEYKNKSLYLFKSDLYDWEMKATEGITVDGKLPSSWGVK